MSDRELLAAYRATAWTVQAVAGPVRLRLTGSPAAPPTLRSAGIITAYNPASKLRSDAENEAANRCLQARLKEQGAELHPAVAGGTGLDAEQWREPGFLATRIDRGTLVALGGDFEQNAIVWIDSEGALSLVVTRPGFCGGTPGDTL